MFVEVPVYRWGAWHGLALALDRLGDNEGAAAAELEAYERGAGEWARENVEWWRGRTAAIPTVRLKADPTTERADPTTADPTAEQVDPTTWVQEGSVAG